MSQVLQHVIDAITPASQASADAVRMRLRDVGSPMLERLATAIAAAQHTTSPRIAHKTIVVVAGDHGCGDPGIAMGEDHPTIVAARAIAGGTAALCAMSRGTPIVLVDAGTRERVHMPPIAIALGRGPTHDLLREPAQTVIDAGLSLEAGIALALSLLEPPPADTTAVHVSAETPPTRGSDDVSPAHVSAETPPTRGSDDVSPAHVSAETPPTRGSDDVSPAHVSAETPPTRGSDAARGVGVLAVGAIGVGAEVASAALLGAVLGATRPLPERDDAAELAMLRATTELRGASGLELLAHVGGPETGVLAGLMLAAASMNVPVILDSYATGTAALVAAALAPNVVGYLVAAHRGSFTMPGILEHLGLTPVFEVGVGHGEGTGAAMVLPLLDQVAALAARR